MEEGVKQLSQSFTERAITGFTKPSQNLFMISRFPAVGCANIIDYATIYNFLIIYNSPLNKSGKR